MDCHRTLSFSGSGESMDISGAGEPLQYDMSESSHYQGMVLSLILDYNPQYTGLGPTL